MRRMRGRLRERRAVEKRRKNAEIDAWPARPGAGPRAIAYRCGTLTVMRLVGLAFVVALAVVALATCRTYDTIYTDDAGGQCVAAEPHVQRRVRRSVDGSIQLRRRAANACLATELCDVANGKRRASRARAASSRAARAARRSARTRTIDSRNCGGCGELVRHGPRLPEGQCACPLTTCGTACVDTTTDVNNCGGCDTRVPDGGAERERGLHAESLRRRVRAVRSRTATASARTAASRTSRRARRAVACATARARAAGPCTAGMCAEMTYIEQRHELAGTAVDSSFVYWVDHSTTGAIRRAPIGGATPQTYLRGQHRDAPRDGRHAPRVARPQHDNLFAASHAGEPSRPS